MRNKRFRLGVAAVVVGVGLVALPASPAAADPVTYPDVQCEIRFPGGISGDETWTWTMEGEGPSGPVAPGSTFTLSGLTVIQHAGLGNYDGELTVLGQVIELGRGVSEALDGQAVQVWGPMNVELVAPTEFDVHDIVPQATWSQAQTGIALGTFCPREGEAFPDVAFAQVEVADVPPNGNGNGNGTDNGNGNGDPNGEDPNGVVDPDADVDAELDAEAELEAELEAEAAERALTVGASPRFTG